MEKRDIIGCDLKIINIGIESFTESLKVQGVDVIQVDWSPPARGDKKMIDLLSRLGSLSEM